jgi:hypothetical protein
MAALDAEDAPVRLGVLRPGPDPGVVGLLTGDLDAAGTAGPARAEVLPLRRVTDGGPARLSIGPGQATVLERLAGQARDRELPPATRAWLRTCRRTGQPCFPAVGDDFGGPQDAARAWRRVQDLAVHTIGSGATATSDAEALEPLFAEPVVRRGGHTGRALLGDEPGRVELVDIQARLPGDGADASGAVRRLAGACHAVLVLFPAADVSTDPGPRARYGRTAPDRNDTVTWLRAWADVLRTYPNGPTTVYLALSLSPSAAVPMPELAQWLSGRLPLVLGTPRARPRVHALAVAEAEQVTRVLARPEHGPAALVEQARAHRGVCGLEELADGVAALVRDRSRALPGLTLRRLAAAFDDTRMICRDTAPPQDGAPADATRLWYRLETHAVGLLATRAARSTDRRTAVAPRQPDGRPERPQEEHP